MTINEPVTRNLNAIDNFSKRAAAERAVHAEKASGAGAAVSVATGTVGGAIGGVAGAFIGLQDAFDATPNVVRDASGAITEVRASNLGTTAQMMGLMATIGAVSTGLTALTPSGMSLEAAAVITGGFPLLWPALMGAIFAGVGACKGFVAGFRKGGTVGYEIAEAAGRALTGKAKQIEAKPAVPALEAPSEIPQLVLPRVAIHEKVPVARD